jgi:hypothetical protein
MHRIACSSWSAEFFAQLGPRFAPRALAMTSYLTRRAFIEETAMLISSAALPSARERIFPRTPVPVRIGFATMSPSDHRLGFDLGVDEAQHAATMFGATVETRPLAAPQSSDRDLTAIVGATDLQTSIAWIKHAAAINTLFINVGCTNDALRDADCSRSAFHVIPSDAMSRDAIASAHVGENPDVRAWDSTLKRFGADTLNKRFTARFHQPMNSAAWAAWFAVKVLWESALRQRSGDASAVSDFLMRDTTQFDGHKGSPLSFRSWDHQLRQPLYVGGTRQTSSGSIVEVPSVSSDDSPRAALDKLGTSRSATRCRIAP